MSLAETTSQDPLENNSVIHKSQSVHAEARDLIEKIKNSAAYTQSQAFFELVNQKGSLQAFLGGLKIDKQAQKVLMHEVQALSRNQLSSQASDTKNPTAASKKINNTPKQRLHI